MKNLIIFVLVLIAWSSVFSVKLNKVLKEEKVLSVSVPNENLALKSETLTDDSTKRGDKDKDGRRKVESNLETSNEVISNLVTCRFKVLRGKSKLKRNHNSIINC